MSSLLFGLCGMLCDHVSISYLLTSCSNMIELACSANIVLVCHSSAKDTSIRQMTFGC